jgi:hypothetical protein
MESLATKISRLVQRESQQPLEAEEDKAVTTNPLVQRVPVAVREDDEEEKVAPKLESDAALQEEEKEKPVQAKLETDTAIRRQAKEDEEGEEEPLQSTAPIQRQMEDRDEEKVQKKPLSSLLFRIPEVSPISVSASGGAVQRLCTECAGEKQREEGNPAEMIQRKSARYQLHDDHDEEEQQVQPKGVDSATPSVTTSVDANIRSLNHGGSPLPLATRAFFEPRFGADFSQVRVHTDTRTAGTAKSINAKAFTVGRDIAFGAGQYAPHSRAGRQLLSHELTHVVQQNGSQLQRTQFRATGQAPPVATSLESGAEMKGGAKTPGKDLSASGVKSGELARRGLGQGEVLSQRPDDRGNSRKGRLNFLSTAHGQTEGVRLDLAVVAQPKASTSVGGDTAEDQARAVEAAMVRGSPYDLGIQAMSRGSIQRSAGDDAGAIKQKLKDTIDKAFLARDTWKASDNIGQAIYSERLGLLLGRKSADKFASMQELDAYIAESDKAALTELDTMAKLGLDHVDRFPHVFPLTWAARVRDALSLEVDLESLKKRLEEDSKYADSLAKRVPTSLFWWGLARTYDEALKSEAPFKLELRHAEWHKAHVTRDYALGWIEYARTQAQVSFYEFWQKVVQSLSDDISSGKIKLDHTFQAGYKDFVANKRAMLLAIPGKIRAFGPSQPELPADQILTDVQSVALVVNNLASLGSKLTFVPIWSKAETEHAAKVTENDASIAGLDQNGRVIQAMLWAYEGDYFSEAGKRAAEAIKAGAKEQAAEMAGAMIAQMIPYVNVAVDLYFLYQGVKGIDAGLKGLQAAFVSASNAATTVDLQRESAKLALAITGQGASLILSLLAAIGAVSSLRAKAAKIKAENPKMSEEEAMNKALKDTPSKEAAALRGARKKQLLLESKGFSKWKEKLSPETKRLLDKNPELEKVYAEMNPTARELLTLCNTPCVPEVATAQQGARIEALISKLEIKEGTETFQYLREHLHNPKNRANLDPAIKKLEGLNTKAELQAKVEEFITEGAKAKGMETTRRPDRLWEVTLENGPKVTEYSIQTHANAPGTKGFFQSHHGIQGAWGRARVKGYIYADSPTILLRDSKMGSPHQIVSSLQKAREGGIATRTYAKERQLFLDDMKAAGVPDVHAKKLRDASDAFFAKLYAKTPPSEVKSIFGDWQP